MPRNLIILSFFSILLGCATTSRFDTRIDKRLTPPLPKFLAKWKHSSEAEIEKLAVGSSEDNIKWWKNYTLAQKLRSTSPIASCDKFTSLATEASFPLHDLALLRAYEVCLDHSKLPDLPSTVAPWYRELLVELNFKESARTTDILDDLKATIEKARVESNKKNKEELYQSALGLAEKEGLTEEITQIQEALYKNSPRLKPEPAFKELNAVAADFRFHRQFDDALKVYQEILKSKQATSDDKFSALKNIRQTYKVAQRKQDFIQATVNLANWTKKEYRKNKKDKRALTRWHDAQILLARTLWTEDQTSTAISTLQETQKNLQGLYPLDEAFFILGRIDEEKGNFLKAIEYFEASYNEPVSSPGLRDKIAWLKSWNYIKLENWSEAQASLEKMRDLTQEPSEKARARFWLARSLEKLGQTTEAQQELQTLIKEDPLGYYGVLAVRELKQTFPPIHSENQELESLSLLGIKELDPQSRLTAEWLITLNEKTAAEKIINSFAEELRKGNIKAEPTWLSIASAYARTGLYLPLFATIGALQPEVKDRLLDHHPDLLFPQPFSELIAQASQKSGTPQEFIYSIIRQESAFNPEARSPADALGLMQLLPSVAEEIAKRNSLPYTEAQDLFKPEINIPLGAFELKSLMEKYDNQFILAVSGYNANGNAIKGWLKTRFRPDPVEFIEEVPYEETRGYIKLTMRNYVFYQRLLNPTLSTPFPESLLLLKNAPSKN